MSERVLGLLTLLWLAVSFLGNIGAFVAFFQSRRRNHLLQHLSVTQLTADDLFVFTTPASIKLSDHDADHLRQQIRRLLAQRNIDPGHILVLDAGVTLSVLRPRDLPLLIKKHLQNQAVVPRDVMAGDGR